jgi:hypothetical protein
MNERLLMVANPGAEHVGAHLLNATRSMALEVRLHDLTEAFRWKKSINWWLRGRLPSRLEAYSAEIVESCRDWVARSLDTGPRGQN